MKRLLFIAGMLLLLVGCSASPDLTSGEEMTSSVAYEAISKTTIGATGGPTIEEPVNTDVAGAEAIISELAATLLRHDSVLEVAPVTIPARALDPILEFAEYDGWPHREFVIYRIRYESGGYEVIGYVSAPIDFLEREYPILIYNRGGNRTFGALTPDRIVMFPLRGYIVLASQYRGVAGGTGMEQFGGDDINDVLKLIDISESFGFAQQGGVYMFGGSRGGMMTYIASRMDERIRAAAVWAGISNSFEGFHEREFAMRRVFIELVGGTPDELPEEFKRRSAVMWADEIMVPLLIGHGGDADWRVPPHHAVNMADALERYGRPHRLVIYPDADHGGGAYFMDFLNEMDEWFRLHPIQAPTQEVQPSLYEHTPERRFSNINEVIWQTIDTTNSGFTCMDDFLATADNYFREIGAFLHGDEWPAIFEARYRGRLVNFNMVNRISHVHGGNVYLHRTFFEHNLAPIAHEITHIVLPHWLNGFLGEGIATYCQERFGNNPTVFTFGVDVHGFVALYGDEIYRVLDVAWASREIRTLTSPYRVMLYTLSHSFTQYIIDSYGIDFFLELYFRPLSTEYNEILRELKSEWIVFIQNYEVTFTLEEAVAEMAQTMLAHGTHEIMVKEMLESMHGVRLNNLVQ